MSGSCVAAPGIMKNNSGLVPMHGQHHSDMTIVINTTNYIYGLLLIKLRYCGSDKRDITMRICFLLTPPKLGVSYVSHAFHPMFSPISCKISRALSLFSFSDLIIQKAVCVMMTSFSETGS